MTTLLQDGVTWLGGQLKDTAGRSMTYRRGSNTVAITGVAKKIEYELMDDSGVLTSFIATDIDFVAEDLVIGGAEIAPRAGDTITETLRSVARTYEVLPIGSKKCWEPKDDSRLTITVHTKEI